MRRRPYEEMSKAELLAEVRRLHDLVESDRSLASVVTNLEVHRTELEAEQAKLVESQQLLEEALERYADLFAFAPIAYVLLSAAGVVVDINLSGARLLGVERVLAEGRPFRSFVVAADRRAWLDHLARCGRTEDVVETEISVRARDGRVVPVHISTKRSNAMSGRVVFHLAVLDMTERKRAAEERRLAEEERRLVEHREQLVRAANDAKDRFLAVLSHELRTPLTPILLALASVKRAGMVPGALAPTVEMIRRNVELEARLIDDLLDVTRITQGKLRLTLQPEDLHAIVEDVVALCAEEVRAAGVQVSLELAADASHVSGDATRLRQVVWNLLKNAIRHTPRGGRITIRSVNPAPGRVVLEVCDTGTGIEAATLERLFRPFEQGPEEGPHSAGLGLGLAICRGIVEAHGGGIAAASDGRDRGARFTVELATVGAPTPAIRPARRATRSTPRPKKVLLVEDNRDNATAIAELLRVHGYEVEVADSVRAAVEQARSGFDVLVSDIGLPDGTGRD